MDDLRSAIGAHLDIRVSRMSRLGGGDFAEAFRVELTDGTTVFAKTHRDPPPNFFTTEASGLEWLRSSDGPQVPEVLAVSDRPPAMLVLRWIDTAPNGPNDDGSFGRQLAALHRRGAEAFGRADSATTGSLALPNDPCDTWVEFYRERRLAPLARIATERGSLDPTTLEQLDVVIDHLAELAGPEERAARLHGDLWAGNRLFDTAGRSWLVDPAAHGGHREFDLAMMRLFGGFSEGEFDCYQAAFPLEPGWQQRVPLHQLAPLIVHAIKFGGPYRASTQRALDSLLA